MNVLIVCSGNFDNFNFEKHQPFISEQMTAIEQVDDTIKLIPFFIVGKGLRGYLNNLRSLNEKIISENIEVVHAHFSFSALLANLQRKIPVVTTYHGSDINSYKNRIISVFVALLSKKNIFVSNQLKKKMPLSSKKKDIIIPCGINLNIFKPRDKSESRKQMQLNPEFKYILFSSSFSNPVKNFELLQKANAILSDVNIKIIELVNYSRNEVCSLLNAADVAIMTSKSEGSPQFIKEALACNCPIISTNVGDVKELISDVYNCYITDYDPDQLASTIRTILQTGRRTNGNSKILDLDNKLIADKVVNVYKELRKQNG